MEGKGGDYREIIIWQSWENGESSNGPVWRKKRRKLLAGRREDGLRQFWRTIASVRACSKPTEKNFLFIKSSKKHHSHSLRKECVQYVYQSKSKYYFLTNCICCQDYTRLDIDHSQHPLGWGPWGWPLSSKLMATMALLLLGSNLCAWKLWMSCSSNSTASLRAFKNYSADFVR